MSRNRIDDLIALEAEAAESAPDTDRVPRGTKVTRGSERTRVLQVRLNVDELDAVKRVAAQRNLPPSTVVRAWILERLATDPGSVKDVANRAHEAIDQLVSSIGRSSNPRP